MGPFKVLDKERHMGSIWSLQWWSTSSWFQQYITDKQGTPSKKKKMHLPLPFLSQSSSTKRQTYPRYFHLKNVLTWTALSFVLLILSPRVLSLLTDSHSRWHWWCTFPKQRKKKQKIERKKEKKKKKKKRTNKQDCLDDKKGM